MNDQIIAIYCASAGLLKGVLLKLMAFIMAFSLKFFFWPALTTA